MSDCVFSKTLTGYSYFWPDVGIRINLDQIDDEGKAEFWCWHENGGSPKLLHISRENLLSTRSLGTLASALEQHGAIDWRSMLTYVSAKTIQMSREGEPVRRLGGPPATMATAYTLEPILELNQPTTIYGPGSSAKSYLAAFIACLVHYNVASASLRWFPTAGNVLYLDWEATPEDHARRIWAIKQGLGIDEEDDGIFYRQCFVPLAQDITAVQRIVYDHKIVLVIIDSQMAASGYGQDPAQVASQYYNALRSLRCTTLTIDHVDKQTWRGGNEASVGPYGSVVKWNRSRSQFEVRKAQNPGDSFFEMSLIHRKHNEGQLLKPIGLRFSFEGEPLERVVVTSCDLSQNEMLAMSLSNRTRIAKYLLHGQKSIDEIAQETGIARAVVKTELYRHKEIFIKEAGTDRWGVIGQAEFLDE